LKAKAPPTVKLRDNEQEDDNRVFAVERSCPPPLVVTVLLLSKMCAPTAPTERVLSNCDRYRQVDLFAFEKLLQI